MDGWVGGKDAVFFSRERMSLVNLFLAEHLGS